MADKDYNVIYKKLEQLNENQTKVASKLEFLQKNIENINNTISSLSERVAKSDERLDKKINVEIKSLKKKVEEISSELKIVKADSISQINDVRDADSCYSGFSVSSKVAMATGIDKDTIRAAYEDVRADGSPTEWAVFKFEGARIVCSARGSDFTEFRTHFADDERAFGYLRLQMGDEMSKRKKFMLVTWVGPNVSVINRAKMSTDKAIIKDIISNFAVELQLESQAEIDIDQFKDALNRAGGANYGTGIRE